MTARQVVVVGGGLAGLTAAQSLAEAGLDVLLLERGHRPGGRASSSTVKSFRYEPGAHLLSGGDRHLLQLLARSDLAPQLLPLRPVVLAQVHRGTTVSVDSSDLRGIARLPGIGLHRAFRLARLERLLTRFAPLLCPEEPERGELRDDRSIADFARLYFGAALLERWIEPFVSDTLLCESERASRLLFLLQFAARRWFPYGTLRDDLGRVAEGLARSVGARLGEEVLRVEPGGAGRLQVHHRGEGGEAAVETEAVVLALPAPEIPALAGELLSSTEARCLHATDHTAAIGVGVGFERPVTRHATRVRVPPVEGWPLAALTLEPGVEGGRVPEGDGLAVLTSGHAFALGHMEASDEQIASALLPYLARLYPGTASRVSWTEVTRYRRAVPRFDVGRYRALARLRRVEADQRARGRRLYFAGDFLVAPTLEGAVVSGLRAAAALRSDLAGC